MNWHCVAAETDLKVLPLRQVIASLCHRCRNTDQLTFQIDQCSPAIARIDRGVGLNRVGNRAYGAVDCAHDTTRYGLCDAERIAKCQYLLTNFQLRGVSEYCS